MGTQTCAMGLAVIIHLNSNKAAKRLGWIEVGPERCFVFFYHVKDSFLGSILMRHCKGQFS